MTQQNFRNLPPAAESFTLTDKEYVENPGSLPAVLNVLTNWHNEHHPATFAVCSEQPCNAVRKVAYQAVESARPQIVTVTS